MSLPKLRERRRSMRFDKVFPVAISSSFYGEVAAVARNISEGGMLIETPFPYPLGTEVRVHFQIPDSRDAICARAEVKNHYALNYTEGGEICAARGMGVRFVEFVRDVADQPQATASGMRTLH